MKTWVWVSKNGEGWSRCEITVNGHSLDDAVENVRLKVERGKAPELALHIVMTTPPRYVSEAEGFVSIVIDTPSG